MSNENVQPPEDVEMEDCDEEGGIRIGDIYLPPPPPPACTFDFTGPRLIIGYIENDFFKSYGGKQVLGPFHKSFTSIVGPNGSGKSNVIDSMLFVFGYRAQKIRSKKISVLIHNSDSHPNVQSCTVSVHFRKIVDINDDEFTEVPDSEFVVARTAFKDNSSYYQINGKRCQFKAVAKLLRSNGIDLDHNRFLILQGEVEQIAMMKPIAQSEHDTGMLEYLEDIVGSSRFKEPIEILSGRVEELNEQRTEKLNRVKIVEKEKDDLEEPKNEAVSHLKQENEVNCKKNILFQRYILDSSLAKEKAQAKKQEIDDGMSDMKKQLKELDDKRKAKEVDMKSLGKELERIAKEKETYSDQFKSLDAEDAKLQEDLKHKNQKRKKLIAQVRTQKEKLEELEKIPEKNKKDIEECEGLKETFENNWKTEEAEYHKAMASLNSETQQLQDEKKTFETKLIGLQEVVDDKKSSLDIAQSELDIYLSNGKREEKILEQYKTALEKAFNTVSSRGEELKKLKVEVPNVEGKIMSDKRELQTIVPKLAKSEDDLKSARVKLEETRSSMQSSKSRGRVQDALMRQKQNGSIPGIYGRLGDLGGIDEKYDVAISTSCGALDNVVVDTVETGQKCINYLKHNNIGTCTFIALDKMEKWRQNAENRIQTPENVPRLFDMVKIANTALRTAFYFALRDTLVASDLDQASRIAYGRVRHRVVTLKGELIEPSGTMSGGGRSMLKGRMGKAATVVAVDPREVAATESNVEALTNEVNQMRRRKADLEDAIQTNTRDLAIMKSNLIKYDKEVAAADQEKVTLQAQMKEQEAKVKMSLPDKSKLKEMEKDIGAKVKLFNDASEKARKIEEEVNRVHGQIIEITGGKTKKLKKALADTKKKLEKVKAEITRLQVAITTSMRNYTKTKDNISGMEAEIKEAETELLALKSRKTEIEEEAACILKDLEAATQKELSGSEQMQTLKEEYDSVNKEENAIKSQKIEVDQEIEKYDGIIKENKSKISHWKKQLGRLDLVDIPANDLEEDEDNCRELKQMSPEELQEIDPKLLQCQITALEEKLSQAKPNLAVLQEYKKKEEVYLQRVKELEEITTSRNEQRGYHEDLRKQRLNEFMSGFTIISNKLKEMYQMITLGGDAELELVDSLDPFSEGIVFSVRPPKKSWKNITNLSGGEKTLSSLALVFALHYYKPTPLYVMDEIDAALDFKNVSIVGNYIKERTKNAQFIIISLRSQMFELADRLVGIYKTYNCTKSVTINPSIYGKKADEAPPPADLNNTMSFCNKLSQNVAK